MRYGHKQCVAMAVVGSLALAGSAGSGVSRAEASSTPPDQPVRRSSLVQERIPNFTVAPTGPQMPQEGPPRFPRVFRSIDGVGNNTLNPAWGCAGSTFIRFAQTAYGGDGSGSTPARPNNSSARLISNFVCAQTQSLPNMLNASDFVWQWGQWIDHDVTETPVADPAEPFDIAVPRGDAYFDPDGTGAQTIALDRSAGRMVDGVRQQLSLITAFIDASQVYGSDLDREMALRTLDGTGHLKSSDGELLPFNTDHLRNAPTGNDPTLFVAGDVRVNEQVGLTCMHTLFMREHNFICDEIRAQHANLTDEEIFQCARAIVAGEIQAITYNEFLPALLGPDAMPSYRGYRPNVDPDVTNVFAAAAYRFGHSMLPAALLRLDENLNVIPDGNIALRDAFFNPSFVETDGIDPVLRGLSMQVAQEVDPRLIDDVRNFLFGLPGQGGFDLASLNIQRGRDHGLASYNDEREAYGLPRVHTFADVTNDVDMQHRLAKVYRNVDEIDPWVGILCEPHVPGGLVGQTARRILVDQFVRLREGDRFWYQTYFPPQMVDQIERQTLAKIIRRNTNIGHEIPDDVFHVPY